MISESRASADAVAQLRERVWTETGIAAYAPMVLETDPSLVESHSGSKENSRPTSAASGERRRVSACSVGEVRDAPSSAH